MDQGTVDVGNAKLILSVSLHADATGSGLYGYAQPRWRLRRQVWAARLFIARYATSNSELTPMLCLTAARELSSDSACASIAIGSCLSESVSASGLVPREIIQAIRAALPVPRV